MAKRAEMYIKARPTGRSLADFGHLCDAEMKVIAATREGTAAIFDGALPTARRTVRADLVRFLALGGDDAAPVHEQGVLILGGCIDGNLDLDGCTLVANLQLLYCELKGELSLRGASTHTISLSGSLCSRIHANSVQVSGDFIMSAGFCATGLVRLSRAQISGRLDCDGGCVEGRKPSSEDSPPEASGNETVDDAAQKDKEEEKEKEEENGEAIVCEGAEIGFQARLGQGFRAAGRVSLVGTTVGFLDCSGGSFEGHDAKGTALNCDGIEVRQVAFLRECRASGGSVSLTGAKIGHDLICSGAELVGRNTDGAVLVCDGASIGGSLFLNGVAAAGQIHLIGTQIRGSVSCGGGVFGSTPGTPAEGTEGEKAEGDAISSVLVLPRATIADTLWLPATFYGGVDLKGARICRIVDAVTAGGSVDAKTNANPAFLALDGLVYDRFAEGTDLSGAARINFLRLQIGDGDLGENFKPQPWEQMIKVLRDMGHMGTQRARSQSRSSMRFAGARRSRGSRG